MPTVEFSLEDLQTLLCKKVSKEELVDGILFAKGEIESENGGELKVDIKDTNRPDLWSVEGIARELKGHYEIETGIAKYAITDSGIEMNVDKKVEKVRAKTVGAVVKGLNFTPDSIKQTIQLQEKVTMTYGKNRDSVAIGVYDYDKIVPPVLYTTVKPGGIKFVPLDFDEELTPEEILLKHPKGQEYGHLIKEADEYPLMVDSNNNVLSIPPIINSVYTGKVTEDTRNVFIEVTGHDLERISIALNVMVTQLADRGGQVESVRVNYPEQTVVTPNLTPKKFELDPDYCRRMLGLDLEDKEISRLLEKSRCSARKENGGRGGRDGKGENGKILVEYPAYRNDVMHQRDIVEDVAIAFDINKIEPEPPEICTTGKETEVEAFANVLREVMVGLGFQEILTFSLTNNDNLFKKMNLGEGRACRITNPISVNWNSIRSWLFPSMMEFLTSNLHVEFPQKIFEVAEVVEIDEAAETGTRTIKKLACAISNSSVSYEDVSSVLDALLRNLGIEYRLENCAHDSFIKGRAAEIRVKTKNGKSEEVIGMMGEIHPRVLNNWGLEKPLVGLELNVSDGMI